MKDDLTNEGQSCWCIITRADEWLTAQGIQVKFGIMAVPSSLETAFAASLEHDGLKLPIGITPYVQVMHCSFVDIAWTEALSQSKMTIPSATANKFYVPNSCMSCSFANVSHLRFV
jgi:hypothetical protein